MKPDIFLISLGCPRNLVDSEVLIGSLKKKGFRVFCDLDSLAGKDKKNQQKDSIAVINTCGFIEDAKNESIDIIMELADLKKKGSLKSLIITGCLSQRYSKYLMKEIGEIDGVFGSSTFTAIPEYIEKILDGKKIIKVDKTPKFLYDHKAPRQLLTPGHSVYVKIQEGCRNCCSYCVIPQIRGSLRSRALGSVLEEISSFAASGAKEVSLIGQDTTFYGIDKYGEFKLAELMRKSAQIMRSGWLRLLYTHPAHYTKELIDVIKTEPSICKYLDLPIQHINDRILKRMNRKATKKEIITLIADLRKNIPDVGIRTSVIVGFPGESDKDFKELENFLKEIKFERLGAFIYSREEGTKAFGFPRQIPEDEKKRRLKKIMETQKAISEENNRTYLGKTLKVLIDEPSEPGQYIGRTEHDAPEVDGTVYVKSKKTLKPGDFVNVKIEDILEYDLLGSVVI